MLGNQTKFIHSKDKVSIEEKLLSNKERARQTNRQTTKIMTIRQTKRNMKRRIEK